jgi:hypothetical protein
MMKKSLWVLSLAAVIAGGLFWAKPAAGPELKAGDPAPEFKQPRRDRTTYSLAALKGQAVVLAWFPKAFTGG